LARIPEEHIERLKQEVSLQRLVEARGIELCYCPRTERARTGLPMKVVCVTMFVAACYLLYFGSGMLLVAPGYPGERYLASARILYGVMPVLASAVLLTTTGWLWSRSGASISVKRAITNAFSLAVAAIILFWIGLLIAAGIRQG